jgi:hypothetical protein
MGGVAISAEIGKPYEYEGSLWSPESRVIKRIRSNSLHEYGTISLWKARESTTSTLSNNRIVTVLPFLKPGSPHSMNVKLSGELSGIEMTFFGVRKEEPRSEGGGCLEY